MKVFEKLKDLLFPPKCMFCRNVIDAGYVCKKCAADIPKCGTIDRGGEFFSKCTAALYYTGNVRRALMSYKFYGRRAYGAGFAGILADKISEEFSGEFDVITWVPISAKRLRKRGYDQSREIAEKSAELLGTKALPALIKSRHTPAQSTLKGREKRAANVAGAYEVKFRDNIKGRRVLLVDDIYTTGATLSECSRTLLMAGAEDVLCVAVASASKKAQK